MPLNIQTFSDRTGDFNVFKSLGHPLSITSMRALVCRLEEQSSVALYDPRGMLEVFSELYDLKKITICGVYVQDIEKIGLNILGHKTEPITELKKSKATSVFVVAYDADRLCQQICQYIPDGCVVESLDTTRIPPEFLTRPAHYTDRLNWATNFAFFRDSDLHHTRIVTANYWGEIGRAHV